MTLRVVITGMGLVAPNANTVGDFDAALRAGRSGLRFIEQMQACQFGCQVAGVPQGIDPIAAAYFDQEQLLAMNSSHRYGCMAAIDAWTDAGLVRPALDSNDIDWDTGAIIGTGVGGIDTIGAKVVPFTDAGRVKRLGSTIVEQVMGSGVSARLSGLLALGNQVTSNSSACATGTEALVLGLQRIRAGRALRMLCGGAEGSSHYSWAGFDAMRVLARSFNAQPTQASRPMSASAAGFIPGSGAGVLLLESLESARARGARIHAEVAGGFLNCGGHRRGGSMTAPNPVGVQRCIRGALDDAGLDPAAVDAISGHLTATAADPREVRAWAQALERAPEALPPITSTKSLIGHALGAAGAIESVAAVLMLKGGYIHPSINCEDLHPEITPYAAAVPHQLRKLPGLDVLMKASFGFGDVNASVVFKRWKE